MKKPRLTHNQQEIVRLTDELDTARSEIADLRLELEGIRAAEKSHPEPGITAGDRKLLQQFDVLEEKIASLKDVEETLILDKLMMAVEIEELRENILKLAQHNRRLRRMAARLLPYRAEARKRTPGGFLKENPKDV